MGAKVTYDPTSFEIVVTQAPVAGVVSLDFKVDVYSDGKEDWLASDVLARSAFPVRAVGGEPLPGALTLDPTFFIIAPWKIRPYDADHELIVTGNVYREDGASIFLSRPGRTITVTLLTTFSAGASATAVTPADTAVAVWQYVVELGLSAEQGLRLLLSMLTGNATAPAAGGAYAFRDLANTKDRIAGTLTGAARVVTTRDGT